MTTTTITGTSNTYSVETTVAVGDVLRFDPNVTTTLVMDNKNLIIYGRLEMRPANANVIHTLRFINVDEAIMVGGGMVPLSTDIGLWVMDNGLLDAVGTTKAGWLRAGTHATWDASDEMLRVPWTVGNYSTYTTHTLGTAPSTVTAPNGNVYTQEVMNLTRNVRIEGTAGHKSHVFIRADVPQTIAYVQFRYLGPLTAQGNSLTVILGRWPVHLHHLGDAGIGTTMTGLVARDCATFCFVSHASNGVYWDDCISYNSNNQAYWWDQSSAADFSFDVTYNHCIAAKVVPIPSFRGFALSSFMASPGTGTFQDCVAVGNVGNINASGYAWPEQPGVSPHGLWEFNDCIAHNNQKQGIYAWQNDDLSHHLHDYAAFRNGDHGIRHGAYANRYLYNDLTLFENGTEGFNMLANSAGTLATRLTVHDVVSDGLLFGEHVLTSTVPALFRDCEFGTAKVLELGEPTGHQGRYDLVNTDLDQADWTVTFMHPLSVYRVQKTDATAYQVNPDGSTPAIAAFYHYISTLALTQATQNVAYSQTLVSQLGVGTITWGLKSGSGPLPTGLSLSSGGVISGTPTVTGTYPITVEVTDTNNSVTQKAFSVVVASGVTLQVTTTNLPGAFVGTAYSQTVTATGGAPPYGWSLTAGSLPAGLTLSSTGVISGTPTTSGLSSFTVRVVDAGSGLATRALTIDTVNLNPDITTTALPSGAVGLAYSFALAATAGTPPYTWSITSGTLPTGITLSSAGELSGTPTAPSSPTLGIRVTDAAARTDNVSLGLVVTAAVSIDDAVLPDGLVGESYSFTFTATAGTAPYSFAPSNPAELPNGVVLGADGELAGTPTQSGTFVFSAIVIDANSITDDLLVSLTVFGLFLRPQPGDSLAGFPALIAEIETFLEADDTLARSGSIGSAVVTAGATTLTLTSAFTQPNASYQAVFEPSWQTTVASTSKSATGLVVSFGVPAPTGGGTVRWRLKR